MTIHFDLHRFGADEFAVGHLINGDLPEDDEERWRIVDAPRYRIRKLLDEHLRAQAALRDCCHSGKPFVLFLRSFSSEHRTTRMGRDVAAEFSLHSLGFQQWLTLAIADEEIPILKLHGGSDSLLSDMDDHASVLSTHSGNWNMVAAELVEAASAIVFLVSHMTAGVVQEFELIRKHDRMHRCLVVVLDPSHTPDGPGGATEHISARLADFPNVFQLHPGAAGTVTSYPEDLRTNLRRLLDGARTRATLERSLDASFTYLEPGFTDSEEFATTETFIWRQLRLMRVLFEDTYWAALKSHGIPFEHFTFPGPWTVAHQIYGLAVATADFRAIREALSYLSLLYIFRGADFALLIGVLAAQYGELAAQIFNAGEPDTEAQYAPGTDLLKLPAKTSVAIELFQHAEAAGRRQDLDTATYLYHAAVICALRARDGDEGERQGIVAHICLDWAMFQGQGVQLEWAVTNGAFAAALFRDLTASDPDRYTPELAQCLNNFGSLHFRRRDFLAAQHVFAEALDLRHGLPVESPEFLVNLYNSLANLALVRVELGELESARALFAEALSLCEKRLSSDPAAVVDLTRLQAWTSFCLVKIPAAEHEAFAYARRAAANLAVVSRIQPESVAALRQVVDEALQATSGTITPP